MRLRLLCLCFVALSFLGQALATFGQEVKRASTHAVVPQATYRGGLITPPLPKPRFVLTDTSGAPFDFWNRTQGSITLLFFGYTYCPDECPMHMAKVGAALKKLPHGIAGQVKLVFVTTDPARDTPADLRHWLDHFDKRFVGLTGTPAALDAAQKAAGVPLAQREASRNGYYSVTHANFVVAYTKDNLGHVIYPGGVSEEDWIHDLPLLVRETWDHTDR
jgi:protein SCO1/2